METLQYKTTILLNTTKQTKRQNNQMPKTQQTNNPPTNINKHDQASKQYHNLNKQTQPQNQSNNNQTKYHRLTKITRKSGKPKQHNTNPKPPIQSVIKHKQTTSSTNTAKSATYQTIKTN